MDQCYAGGLLHPSTGNSTRRYPHPLWHPGSIFAQESSPREAILAPFKSTRTRPQDISAFWRWLSAREFNRLFAIFHQHLHPQRHAGRITSRPSFTPLDASRKGFFWPAQNTSAVTDTIMKMEAVKQLLCKQLYKVYYFVRIHLERHGSIHTCEDAEAYASSFLHCAHPRSSWNRRNWL